MTNKRNLVMGIFLSLLIITLMTFSLTYARYTDELQSDSEISGDIEYIVSNQIEVDSVNSFISAIENGYTNIKISDDVDNPLVITGGVSDVNSDLTIDLNGHELQRNNRDPVLNVTDGVRLTIKDSKGGGCFYNPVGSALRVSGGTLTVTSGIFESGPRTGHGYPEDGDGFIDANYRYAGEYVTGNTSAAGAEIGDLKGVTYYTPNVSGGYSETSSTMPIITPNVQYTVTENNEKRFRINGNMYFDSAYSAQIPADTYLYYTISGANVENTNMAATDKSADFYYTYYVTQDAGTGAVTYAGTTESADTLLVTVYGYTGVKKGADSSANFAAIQMEDGYLDVQGGRYTAYFGKGETNCVYASGGEMTVQNGTFEALQSGVCVRMASQSTSAAAGELAVRSGSFYSEEGDTIFVTGGNMSVTGGTFIKVAETSQTVPGANNAAIHVSGGKLVMTGAGEDNRITFSLTGSHLYGINVEHGDASTLAEGDMAEISYAAFTFKDVGNNNYAINSANAAVSVKNTNFTFGGASTSNRCISVSGEDAKASVTTATFTYNGGSSNYAVYSAGGTVTGTDLSFAFNGDGSSNTGIYTTGGTVSLTHGTFNFNEGATGETSGNKGIHSKGGSVEVLGEGNTFIFNADAKSSEDNFGIYSEKVTDGTAGTITCNNSTFIIKGSYSAGILAFGGTVTLGGEFNCTVEDGRDSLQSQTVLSSTAISVEGGTVNLNAVSTITTNGLGITSLPGEGNANSEINIKGNLTLAPDASGDNGTAIYLNGGTLNIAADATVNITCNLAKSSDTTALRWAPAPTDSTTTVTTPDPNNGIYVNGGSLISNGTLNVTHTGVQNDRYENQTENTGNYAFLNQQIKSYAVRVGSSGVAQLSVTIAKGNIQNSVGGGVYVSSGTVSLGTSENDALNIATTGNVLYSYGNYIGNVGTWTYNQSQTGGHAVEVGGGQLKILGGSYKAAHGNGILVRNMGTSTGNTVNISGGTFIGGYNKTGGRQVGPGASYGLYVMSGNITVNISGGTFGSTASSTKVVENVSIGNNSAAAFMGTASGRAEVHITGGNFYAYNGDAMSVFRFADVTFGSESEPLDGVKNRVEIGTKQTSVDVAGISVQDDLLFTGASNRGSNLTIYSENDNGFKINSQGYAIYYGGSQDKVAIYGGTFTGTDSGSGIQISAGLGTTHAMVIKGGRFRGEYAFYYGASASVDDGLLIEGGTFTGTNYGFYFNANPWSNSSGTTNNVAIIGGVFSGGSRAFYATDQLIKVGDVFTEHNQSPNRYATFDKGGHVGNVGGGEGDRVTGEWYQSQLDEIKYELTITNPIVT